MRVRSSTVAILLSVVALISVIALALFDEGCGPGASCEPQRTAKSPVEVPMRELDATGAAAPRLGGPATEMQEEVRRLRRRVETLSGELVALRETHEKLAAVVEPVLDVLRMIETKKSRMLSADLSANRTAAVATLRNVTSAQAQLQATARVDEDQDGTGEYGGFCEMSGAVEGRMGRKLIPPVLSGAFRELNAYGEAERSRYLFRFYLPGPRGGGIGEPSAGFDARSGIDADLAETTWCCYAWPVERGASARTYFMNQAGDVLFTDADYAGPGGGPAPDAAFQRAGTITGLPAVDRRGSDGNTWRPAH